MKFLNADIAPLGLGCWPIGGEMYAADGQSLGYANASDNESLKAVQAAVANGISLFDTAAAYGAGHSERLLATALKHKHDVHIVTKIGIAIDESSKTLTGDEVEPGSVIPAIDRCLKRLERDTIDVVLLHQNELPIEQAALMFDEMDKAIDLGKIRSYGWSTDFTDRAEAMADRAGFVAVEHCMNVLFDAPRLQRSLQQHDLLALIRSPLAMGLLSGRYTADTSLAVSDIRATNQSWLQYYVDGKANPEFLGKIDAVKELLQTDGRTVVQGALGWLWGKSPSNIPIPGARTVAQVEGLAAALTFGALPVQVMAEIEDLIGVDESAIKEQAR